MQDIEREFRPTSWAIDNKISIYVATILVCIAGITAYIKLPKENFPEVVFPQIYVLTIFQGAPPTDIENLITKEIEKEIKSINGIKKITSNTVQNYSSVIIEFDTDIDVIEAKRDVQDAVNRAKNELPVLEKDPEVYEIDISELPIMNINLAGDFNLQTLKRYAEQMQDCIEALPEIRRVDIVVALYLEIQDNIDL